MIDTVLDAMFKAETVPSIAISANSILNNTSKNSSVAVTKRKLRYH
jgi:hypothetical protein